MCSSCRCCCCCNCPGSGSGVGGVDNGITTLPSDTLICPSRPLRFPVYVSYPAFFASDSAINNANIALFR